jgi:hypothetical protein
MPASARARMRARGPLPDLGDRIISGRDYGMTSSTFTVMLPETG